MTIPDNTTLFHAAMKDVTPLKAKKPKVSAQRKPALSSSRKAVLIQESKVQGVSDLFDDYTTPVYEDSVLAFQRPGILPLHIKAFHRGRFVYQDKIDLHGLKPEEAKNHLVQFIIQATQARHRHILVIHGKGGRYREIPVLKNLVNHWLQHLPNVLAFHSAKPQHGGTGAVYVLLKV